MDSFELVTQLHEVKAARPTMLAIGVFDGVHRGHQQLLGRVVAAAREQNARAAALTFFPHPKETITREKGRYYLMPLAERAHCIAQQGIDLVITHPFNEAVRQMRASAFVDALIAHLDMKQLWGGHFSLGYEREGDHAFLSQLGAVRGFAVHQVDALVMAGDERISSSRIRRSLAMGDVRDVAVCLGRPYAMTGEVVYGRQLGRTIGVPTANVAVWKQQIIPANGVYATRVWVDGVAYAAATNVGVRPTVDENAHITIEAHLLHFSGDLYGKTVRIELLEYIRGEQKFDGLDALKAQIAADIAHVSQLVSAD